jgi:hypothetical protein
MEKILALAIGSLATLSGCSDIPYQGGGPQVAPAQVAPAQIAPARWGYKPGERAPSVISEYEFDQLTEQVTNLKAQRATLVRGVRASPPSAARDEYVRSIESLNESIQMLEYRLRSAGRPVPAG